MAKIPFTLEKWLKDKSQRVETRDGRIVHDIWEVKNAVTAKEYRTEVCALIEGEEDALVFFKNGKYLPVNAESPYDLFIVTPEPELTEFEKVLNDLIWSIGMGEVVYNNDAIKETAAKLLNLARKQLVEEQYTSDPRKTDLYKLGKAEALNDLPRWKKIGRGNNYSSEVKFAINGRYLEMNDTLNDVYEMKLLDLGKLPKED